MEFRESNIYKKWIETFINVAFTFLGNTAGIWIGYFMIKFIFFGVWEDLEWPGIEALIDDGVVLLISFSFLTNSIYHSTRRKKFNLFNVLSIFTIVGVALFYARVIAINQTNTVQTDGILYNVSLGFFWGSIVLYYIILIYEKHIELGGNARNNRDEAYLELQNEFQP